MKPKPVRTKIRFRSTLPTRNQFSPCAVLIYDQKLEKRFLKWIKLFPHRIKVTAGENLKSLSSFQALAEKVQKTSATYPKSEVSIISFGGGSVGDVAGFLAATFKRGVPLMHLPSTWLAAIDSAHGGKNALNLGGAKNQIGCFYFPREIFIVKEVLESQPLNLLHDAYGEIAKMGLLDSGSKMRKTKSEIWKLLPLAVNAKMKIVNTDPFETKGKRQALNLGHTLGHVLETTQKMSHGQAVAQGLLFTLELSEQLRLLNSTKKIQMSEYLADRFKIKNIFKKPFLKASEAKALLLQDKKNSKHGSITFVLLKDFGKPVLRNVSFDQVRGALETLKWLK